MLYFAALSNKACIFPILIPDSILCVLSDIDPDVGIIPIVLLVVDTLGLEVSSTFKVRSPY